jgi:thiamine-phosphate pyrophosphorylase
MEHGQSLPLLWLLSDVRNDAALEAALSGLPRGSGFVFRHYHLPGGERQARYDELSAVARTHSHIVVLAGNVEQAAAWGADGVYGPTQAVAALSGLRLGTVHDGDELQAANAARLDGVFLSPVFPTRSHPGAKTLGVLGFHVLAEQALMPVIALGGMTHARARELDWPRWGAIDGLGWDSH